MHSRTIFPKTKLKWIQNLKFFQVFIEMMIHGFFKYFTEIREDRDESVIIFMALILPIKLQWVRRGNVPSRKKRRKKKKLKKETKLKDKSRSGTTNKPGQE